MTSTLGIPDRRSREDLDRIFTEVIGHTRSWFADVRNLVGITIRRPLRKFIAVRDAIVIAVGQFFTGIQDAVVVAVVGGDRFTFIGQTIDIAIFRSAVGNVFGIIDTVGVAVHRVTEGD